MQTKELENQIDFLMSAALQKCGDLHDAEDLTQETLLAALACISQGEQIADLRGWLLTVLNRRYYDMLRRRYRQPTVVIGEDAADTVDHFAQIDCAAEAESVRKAVAYLAALHREAVVRHYMNGQSVAEIARALNVPEGTVKSRLYAGRELVRKGIDTMQSYQKSSYDPITLTVVNSGNCGINGEPYSLVANDLIAQNLLWLAYETPVTVEMLAKAIGIPTAYVEPILQKLVDGELMKAVGNRYYTDFMIVTVEDRERHIPAQKQLVAEHFDRFWRAIDAGLAELRRQEYYSRGSFDQRNALEMYFTFHCLDHGIYRIFCEIFRAEQIFPDRPNGGKWIAWGYMQPKDYDISKNLEIMAHNYSGERWASFEGYADTRQIRLHVYGADGFPAYSYDRSPDYTFFKPHESKDAAFLQLLYILHAKLDPRSVGFNTEILKAIPWLCKCKILRLMDDKPTVNIPILSGAEAKHLWRHCAEVRQAMVGDLKELLAAFYQGRQQKLPPHLTGVPLQKQYLGADSAMLFATVREAIKRGKLYDGDYDNDADGVNQPPCPMVLVVEK